MGIIDASLGRYLNGHPEFRPLPLDPYAIARQRQLAKLKADCEARKGSVKTIDPSEDFDFHPSR